MIVISKINIQNLIYIYKKLVMYVYNIIVYKIGFTKFKNLGFVFNIIK